MEWCRQVWRSSIGGKFVVAITGLGLVGFLVVHMAGNLLVFAGPEAMTNYAQGLRNYPLLLWVARVGLITMALFHISFAVRLNLQNRAARPQAYAKKTYLQASFASRTMVITGLVVLAYALFHLAHFTFRATSPEIAALGPWDVYKMLVLSFTDPKVACTYLAAMAATGLHLSHGVSSLLQTLGCNHPKYQFVIRSLGPVVGGGVALGFGSIPLAVLLGFIK